MKTKGLCFGLAAGLLLLTTFYLNNTLERNLQNKPAPVVQKAAPPATEAGDVPKENRDTLRDAQEYLAKSQFADGHWEGDSGQYPVATTGLAGLALLMERKIGREATYGANIRKAADWLMATSLAPDGLIFSGHESETNRYMRGHGLATLFLAGVYRDERDQEREKKLGQILTQAVKYIASARTNQGGWYYTSRVEGHDFADILPTAIQIQALQAADHAGFHVPYELMDEAREYLQMALEQVEGEANSGQNGGRTADIAAALAGGIDAKRSKGWLKRCRAELCLPRKVQPGSDELGHYYFAQIMYKLGDKGWGIRFENEPETDSLTWSGYRSALFDCLQRSQNKDGSWSAPVASREDLGVGPVYATALWCTVLELDDRNRPHPSNNVKYMKKKGDNR